MDPPNWAVGIVTLIGGVAAAAVMILREISARRAKRRRRTSVVPALRETTVALDTRENTSIPPMPEECVRLWEAHAALSRRVDEHDHELAVLKHDARETRRSRP